MTGVPAYPKHWYWFISGRKRAKELKRHSAAADLKEAPLAPLRLISERVLLGLVMMGHAVRMCSVATRGKKAKQQHGNDQTA